MYFSSGLTQSLPENPSTVPTVHRILRALTCWIILFSAAEDQLRTSSAQSSTYLQKGRLRRNNSGIHPNIN